MAPDCNAFSFSVWRNVTGVRRYRCEANHRWEGFVHRPGDIVVSTRSKCGTTWVQMACLLLVHQEVPIPAPLATLSPWLDWDVEPIDAVRRRLAAQPHRRVIKTHTPLDGLPLHPEVTYVVVGRHPLDVAVSFFHHLHNLDRPRRAELRGGPVTAEGTPPSDLTAWLDRWVDDPTDPLDALDTLPGNVHHVRDARDRAAEGTADVVFLHYDDLVGDLDGQMRALAVRLGVDVPEDRWPELVAAAGFDAMRSDSARTVPDHLGIVRDPTAFFRGGRSGDGWTACTPAQRERYARRVAELADDELVAWLHGRTKAHKGV